MVSTAIHKIPTDQLRCIKVAWNALMHVPLYPTLQKTDLCPILSVKHNAYLVFLGVSSSPEKEVLYT